MFAFLKHFGQAILLNTSDKKNNPKFQNVQQDPKDPKKSKNNGNYSATNISINSSSLYLTACISTLNFPYL